MLPTKQLRSTMGGAETLRAGPSNLNKFAWIGVGKDDRTVTDGPRKLSETLKAHNIRHEFHESEGGHTWINWRLYLRDFTQLLFR
jgi:enterochelin esterase-like enzyme